MNLKNAYSIIFSALIILSASCGDNDNRKHLNDREKQLNDKERQLTAWEQRLKLKEQELSAREIKVDSLKNPRDTVGVYNPKLQGNWKVTMQCTETTCGGSAIGDIKTELWNISYQGNKVIARVTANNKIIRTYSGLFRENSLELTARHTSHTDTHMDVTLTPHLTTEGLMEGQRVINQGGKCKVVYSIKAERL